MIYLSQFNSPLPFDVMPTNPQIVDPIHILLSNGAYIAINSIVMKPASFAIILILFVLGHAKAQQCDIKIQILEGKNMFGHVEKINGEKPIKKMEVNFTDELMKVKMSVDGQNYLIKVVNENCQAYCSRDKRVRQLHSGDEKLVRNLFKEKHDDIATQIRACAK